MACGPPQALASAPHGFRSGALLLLTTNAKGNTATGEVMSFYSTTILELHLTNPDKLRYRPRGFFTGKGGGGVGGWRGRGWEEADQYNEN